MHALTYLLILSCRAQDSVDDIMTRVASNLAQASSLRNSYVYTRKIHTRLLKTNSTVAREEKREYIITPSDTSSIHKLIHFEGTYEKGKKLLPYTDPKFRHKEMDIDGELIEDLADSLVADEGAKDGIHMDLFPFLPKDLPNYTFKLVNTERFRGRNIHRISFEGKSRNNPWIGEALIDAEDLHPVSIHTKLNFKMPFLVKSVLGTNLSQTGFALTYTRLAPGVWFPASYGTEMRLNVLFGYRRVITMSMESFDFRRTAAESSVAFDQ